MLYDGLGYFVVLTGTFPLSAVYSRLIDLRTAANLINIFLFRGGNLTTGTAGYVLFFLSWSLP